MSFQSINTYRDSIIEQVNLKIALEKLAKNLSTENILFLASLSEKPNINKKLENNKTLIKTSL
jgi:hypothetical protein